MSNVGEIGQQLDQAVVGISWSGLGGRAAAAEDTRGAVDYAKDILEGSTGSHAANVSFEAAALRDYANTIAQALHGTGGEVATITRLAEQVATQSEQAEVLAAEAFRQIGQLADTLGQLALCTDAAADAEVLLRETAATYLSDIGVAPSFNLDMR